jgi:predicted HTH transcriptional regulator
LKEYTERLLNDDICQNRHGGNEQSETANHRCNKDNDRQKVLEYFKEHETGTSKEIARYLGKPLNCISGRLTELKVDELIVSAGIYGEKLTREGCEVYKLKPKWSLF